MTSPVPEITQLRLPSVELKTFPTNFLRTVVCEVRFPALISIEQRQVKSVMEAVRKRFPIYVSARAVEIGGSAADSEGEPIHQFKSRSGTNMLSLKHSSFALETTKYVSFDAFVADLHTVVKACEKLIDSDFYTRVGLRYINLIPIDASKSARLDDWINADLVKPLQAGVYGRVDKFMQEIRGTAARRGKYTFRHGFPEQESPTATYAVDFDFYDEGVEANDLMPLLDGFRTEAYDFFAWVVRPATVQRMLEAL